MKKSRRILSVIILLLFAGLVVRAQSTSRVTGTVNDKSGAVVQGAQVTLTNQATGVAVRSTTSSAGTYVFDGIVPGTYSITASAAGFNTLTSTGNIVTIAQPLVYNPTLQIGTASTNVEVDAGSQLVQLETSGDLGALIDQRALTTLPIVGSRGRSPLDLLELIPGVVDGGPLNSSGANITGGGVIVNGSRDRAWNYTLDGIDINETSAPGSNFSPAHQSGFDYRLPCHYDQCGCRVRSHERRAGHPEHTLRHECISWERVLVLSDARFERERSRKQRERYWQAAVCSKHPGLQRGRSHHQE